MSLAERLPQTHSGIADDVADGLGRWPKSLPPRLLYDAQGSRLFDEITALPEYYLTRTEREILETYASEMAERAGSNLTLVELGAGTATKTAVLIDALLRRQLRLDFYPVDVSGSALEIARRRLQQQFPTLKVHSTVADFLSAPLPPAVINGRRKLVLFLGSSIGNFERGEAVDLLRWLRSSLQHGDCLLLGTDLLKSAGVLLPAYDDAAGVTARFNLNLLGRINRELGGHFDLSAFRHRALWNRRCQRMEMYLESLRDQVVRIDALEMDVAFAARERIHTENSYKYTPAMVCAILREGGFMLEHTWTDPRNWFAEHLARAT